MESTYLYISDMSTVCIHPCSRLCVHACMHACMHEENIQMHICIYIYILCVSTYTHTHTWTHTHTYIRVPVPVGVDACVRVHVCVCTYRFIVSTCCCAAGLEGGAAKGGCQGLTLASRYGIKQPGKQTSEELRHNCIQFWGLASGCQKVGIPD